MTSSGIFDNLPRVLWNTVKNSAYVRIRQAREPCPVPDAASSGKRPHAMAYPPSPLSPLRNALSSHLLLPLLFPHFPLSLFPLARVNVIY